MPPRQDHVEDQPALDVHQLRDLYQEQGACANIQLRFLLFHHDDFGNGVTLSLDLLDLLVELLLTVFGDVYALVEQLHQTIFCAWCIVLLFDLADLQRICAILLVNAFFLWFTTL